MHPANRLGKAKSFTKREGQEEVTLLLSEGQIVDLHGSPGQCEALANASVLGRLRLLCVSTKTHLPMQTRPWSCRIWRTCSGCQTPGTVSDSTMSAPHSSMLRIHATSELVPAELLGPGSEVLAGPPVPSPAHHQAAPFSTAVVSAIASDLRDSRNHMHMLSVWPKSSAHLR